MSQAAEATYAKALWWQERAGTQETERSCAEEAQSQDDRSEGEGGGGHRWIFFFKKLFIFGSAGSLLLHRLFSSGGEQGSSLFGVHKLLAELASLVAECGLWACGLQ